MVKGFWAGRRDQLEAGRSLNATAPAEPLVDKVLERTESLVEKAKEKVELLAGKVEEKAEPLVEKVREKAKPLVEKAEGSSGQDSTS